MCLEYSDPNSGFDLLNYVWFIRGMRCQPVFCLARYLLASGGRDRLVHLFDPFNNYTPLATVDDHTSALNSIIFYSVSAFKLALLLRVFFFSVWEVLTFRLYLLNFLEPRWSRTDNLCSWSVNGYTKIGRIYCRILYITSTIFFILIHCNFSYCRSKISINVLS